MTNIITCKDVYGNECPVAASELIQRVGVYAVIISENKILLTRQWGGYSLVGGGVDNGETVEQALVREVQEETGLTITQGELFHQTTTFFKKETGAPAYQSLQLYFSCDIISGEVHTADITESEQGYTNGAPEWVGLDTIEEIDFRHSVDLDEIISALP